MGLFDFLFPKSKQQPQKCVVKKVVGVEHIAVPLSSQFDLRAFEQAAAVEYYRESTKKMAAAAAKVARLIEDNFTTQHIRCMVPPREIVSDANPRALPIHFLFMQDGRPKVAVVIVTRGGYKVSNVLATKTICEGKGIKYLRIFADGGYGDWITGEFSEDGRGDEQLDRSAMEEFCKNRIIERINKALK